MRHPRNRMIVGLCVLIVLMAPILCRATGHARTFLAALEDYQSGDFRSAAAGFEEIARSGVRNGRLYYNLGNAYLKDRQLGPAILWYERALELLPRDPDLRFNLNYARSLTRDAPEQSGDGLLRVLFFWRYLLSDKAVLFLAVGFNAGFWVLLGAWRITRRRLPARGAVPVAVIALVFIATAAWDYYDDRRPSWGIVLSGKAAIRSGLEDASTELFVLHAGAKVRVLKEMKSHYQIRFAADKIGWVDKEIVGLI